MNKYVCLKKDVPKDGEDGALMTKMEEKKHGTERKIASYMAADCVVRNHGMVICNIPQFLLVSCFVKMTLP